MTKKQKESLLKRIEKGLYEYYVTPYRRSFARAQRDEDDLFMLLVFAESMGLPNPAAYYTLELLPLVYDRFHEWHKRMGMERSPLDHIGCCYISRFLKKFFFSVAKAVLERQRFPRQQLWQEQTPAVKSC